MNMKMQKVITDDDDDNNNNNIIIDFVFLAFFLRFTPYFLKSNMNEYVGYGWKGKANL
jgi:hypothetical protein